MFSNDHTFFFLFILIACITTVHNIWYNPLCLVSECCENKYIPNDVNKLKANIKLKVYGQHLVENAIDAIHSHIHFDPPKPLTLSFHGWAGGGKNYVSTFIADSLYLYGQKSKYVHTFEGRIHFPREEHAAKYGENLYQWIKGNASSCERQLFIFDEVDKMPPKVLNYIKPIFDYRPLTDGVDYRKTIFIFLSNTGASLINEHYQDLWASGLQREDMKLSHYNKLIQHGAFNEKGGFHWSDVIKSNLIDHYIPFLPMQADHVRECILDQFRLRNVLEPKEEHVKEVLEIVDWGPDSTKLFAKNGCKRISSQVGLMVAKYYKNYSNEREL